MSLGFEEVEALPDPVKRIAWAVYEECQEISTRGLRPWYATWHKDAVLIERGATIPGNPRPGKDYVAARYFQNIDGFTEDESDVIATPETVEERLWLPSGGGSFILPTLGQNTRYGLPQETTDSLKTAVRAWVNVDLDLTEETARHEVSKFFRGSQGLFAVLSGSDQNNGPLYVSLNNSYETSDRSIGSFPLDRFAREGWAQAF